MGASGSVSLRPVVAGSSLSLLIGCPLSLVEDCILLEVGSAAVGLRTIG